MNAGVAGVVVIALLVVVGLLFWTRGRRLGMGAPAVMGRFTLARGFPRTRRSGYAPEDVEELMDRVYALSSSAGGRADALGLLHEAQFGLARRGGYDPEVVDLHVDAMIVALQTGRELPPRPGSAGGAGAG